MIISLFRVFFLKACPAKVMESTAVNDAFDEVDVFVQQVWAVLRLAKKDFASKRSLGCDNRRCPLRWSHFLVPEIFLCSQNVPRYAATHARSESNRPCTTATSKCFVRMFSFQGLSTKPTQNPNFRCMARGSFEREVLVVRR